MDSGIGSSILSISSSDEEIETNNIIIDSFDVNKDHDTDTDNNNETRQQEKSMNSEDEEDLAFVSFLNQTVQIHKELNNTSLSLHQISLLPEDNFSFLSNTTTPLRKLKNNYNNDSNMKSGSKNINLISPMTPIPLQDDSVYNVSLDLSGSPDLMPKMSENTPNTEKYSSMKSNTTNDKKSTNTSNKRNSSTKNSNKKYTNNQYARPSPLHYHQGSSKYNPPYTNFYNSRIPLFPTYDTNSNSDNETNDSNEMNEYGTHNFTGGIPMYRNNLNPVGYLYPSQYWRDRLRKREMTSILGSPKSKFLFQ